MSAVQSHYQQIQKKIADACAVSGRALGDVILVAASKTQPDEYLLDAYNCGVRHFGENYVQELANRRKNLEHLMPDAHWHLIGSLQVNKVKHMVELAEYFHALDSEKLLNEIAKRKTTKVPLKVFIQVNVDHESTKAGIQVDQLGEFIQKVRLCSAVELVGLMAIPDPHLDTKKAFQKMAQLAKKYGGLALSMGMSEDFEAAIQEGARYIRLGRVLFGERK